MLETAPLQNDKAQVDAVGKTHDRPLIHDIIPQNLGARSDSTTLAGGDFINFGAKPEVKPEAKSEAKPAQGASNPRDYGDKYLEMTPLDYGSSTHKGIATPVDRDYGAIKAGDPQPGAAKPADAKPGSIDSDKPDPFMTNADKLAQSAHDRLGQDLTIAPRGAHLGHVPKKFGCAASVSNVLHDAGIISLKQMSASVDGLENIVVHQLGGHRVDFSELKKGDLVIGRGERDGSGGRHIGVVDTDASGRLVVYNNHNGKFERNLVNVRFNSKIYEEHYGVRIDN